MVSPVSAIVDSTKLEPMKPAPPVTSSIGADYPLLTRPSAFHGLARRRQASGVRIGILKRLASTSGSSSPVTTASAFDASASSMNIWSPGSRHLGSAAPEGFVFGTSAYGRKSPSRSSRSAPASLNFG